MLSGGVPGKLWLSNLSLSTVDPTGLPDGESLSDPMKTTVFRPRVNLQGTAPRSDSVLKDYAEFLASLERNYYQEMTDFIRKDLGVKAPLTGTQANYGGLPSQKNMADLMDFLDVHFYWDHPHIDKTNQESWWMTNEPMVNHPEIGIVYAIAGARNKGKPFTISEYSPNQTNLFAADGPFLTAAYSALQDIDAIMVFNYYYSGGDIRTRLNPNQLLSWYNVLGDPRAECLMPFAANLFRRGDVQPASTSVEVHLSKDFRDQQFRKNTSVRDPVLAITSSDSIRDASGNRFNVLSGLQRRIELVLDDTVAGNQGDFSASTGPIYSSETSQLQWINSPQSNKWSMMLDSSLSKGITGYIGRQFQMKGLTVSGNGGVDQFGTVAVTSVDGKPFDSTEQLIITAIGKGYNSNLTYVPWGGGVCPRVVGTSGNPDKPFWDASAGQFLIGTCPATIQLETSAKRIQVERLDTSGTPISKVDVTAVTNGYSFHVGLDSDLTPWYRVSLSYIMPSPPQGLRLNSE